MNVLPLGIESGFHGEILVDDIPCCGPDLRCVIGLDETATAIVGNSQSVGFCFGNTCSILVNRLCPEVIKNGITNGSFQR